MVIEEIVIINNKPYLHNYSNENYFIERDGVKYIETFDPIDANREYIETNELIEQEGEDGSN